MYTVEPVYTSCVNINFYPHDEYHEGLVTMLLYVCIYIYKLTQHKFFGEYWLIRDIYR